MSSELREYQQQLKEWGFVLIRKGKHAIFRHPCGATAISSLGGRMAGNWRGIRNSLAEVRRELKSFGIDPDNQQPTAPEPEPERIPEPAPILTAPFPIVHVPERKESKPVNPVLSDFGSRLWCVQFHCYGHWVCLEQQLSPDPDRALKQCLPATRAWFAKAQPRGAARIEPKDS